MSLNRSRPVHLLIYACVLTHAWQTDIPDIPAHNGLIFKIHSWSSFPFRLYFSSIIKFIHLISVNIIECNL